MEKKQISVHAFTIHMYAVAVVLLCLALLVLGVKYLHLKFAVNEFTQGALYQQMNQTPKGSISDYGVIIAQAIQYPQTTPLYTQPLQLESYVTTVSRQLHRDVVIVDATQKVLADAVPANMGSKYLYDNGVIGLTLKDGISRSFTENSKDYPGGLSEEVVAMKNDKGLIVGAVIVSNEPISQ